MSARLTAAAILLLGWTLPAHALPPETLDAVVSLWPTWPGDGRPEEPQGSGVAIRADGYLATAAHVVDRATAVAVHLADGRVLAGETVAVDRATDIAVLKVTAELPVLETAPAPAPGDPVCAVANPFGVGLSVSCGVVSAIGRAGMGFNPIEDFIQTDAAVNPGASGGALVDAEGRLVGMISAIFTRDADAGIGINFAVSAAMLARVASDLIAHGRVVRGRPGLRVAPLDNETRAHHAGVRVATVEPAGAAARAGIMAGDIITTIAGRPVRGRAGVLGAIHLHRPGDRIPVTLLRAGQRHDVSLVLAP
jgi:S1-C subfamily serine protease